MPPQSEGHMALAVVAVALAVAAGGAGVWLGVDLVTGPQGHRG